MNSIGGVSSLSGNWFSGKNQNPLPQDTREMISTAFGFTGVKIVKVEKGGLTPLRSFTEQHALQLNKEVATILGMEGNLETVLVVVGGGEMIKSRLKEIKKSMRQIDKATIAKLAKALGLDEAEDVLIFAKNEMNVETGGIWVIQSGLGEIQGSIQEFTEEQEEGQ